MRLEGTTEIYSQDEDDCSPSNGWQRLTVEVMDGGGGPYVVIGTERWAIDRGEIDAFAAVLRAAIDRVEPPEVPEADGESPEPGGDARPAVEVRVALGDGREATMGQSGRPFWSAGPDRGRCLTSLELSSLGRTAAPLFLPRDALSR